MNCISFPDQASAEALQATVDAALGFPKPGNPFDGGLHAPPAQAMTVTYAAPVQLVGGMWGYPVDATNMSALSASQKAQVVPLTPVVPTPPPVPSVTKGP